MLPKLSRGSEKQTILLLDIHRMIQLANRLPPLFFPWLYIPLWVCILQPSSWAIASSRKRFLDHTQRRATVGRTPLDE